MKRTLAIFALCASFLFLFSACGEDTMNNAANDVDDMLDEAGDMMEDTFERSGRDYSGNTGAIMDGGTNFGDAPQNRNATANSRLHGSYNDPTGTDGGSSNRAIPKQDEQEDPAAAKARWQLMLDNAHVHDTDGMLMDGENPQNDTF